MVAARATTFFFSFFFLFLSGKGAARLLTASWLVTTSMVRPASRSAAVSPRQAMTVRPLSMAAVALAAMPSLVSPFCRRSEWPRMAYLSPRSLSIDADTSPVCAPVVACASCAATAKSPRRRVLTCGAHAKGGQAGGRAAWRALLARRRRRARAGAVAHLGQVGERRRNDDLGRRRDLAAVERRQPRADLRVVAVGLPVAARGGAVGEEE
jgi:hypothetical protein